MYNYVLQLNLPHFRVGEAKLNTAVLCDYLRLIIFGLSHRFAAGSLAGDNGDGCGGDDECPGGDDGYHGGQRQWQWSKVDRVENLAEQDCQW